MAPLDRVVHAPCIESAGTDCIFMSPHPKNDPISSDVLADLRFEADRASRLSVQFQADGRNNSLARWIAGGRVMHLGFADHGPLITSKRAQGTWLHDQIMAHSADCIGVDINAEAVTLAQGLGVPGLYCMDVFAPEFAELATRFAPTHVLLPDVLEHLHDPVAFVRRLAKVMPQVPLVVSVPNGLSLRNVWNSWAQVERINTDHLCWYSPFTVSKVLSRGGYAPELWWSSQIAPADSLKGRALSALAAWRPLWADNVMVLSRPV